MESWEDAILSRQEQNETNEFNGIPEEDEEIIEIYNPVILAWMESRKMIKRRNSNGL